MEKIIFSKSKNRVVIDADGCPVVRNAARLAREYSVKCSIVADSAHCFSIDTAETVVVSQGADAADFYIVNNIQKGDLVITQDYGLAAMCLAKNALVLNQDGKSYDNGNIDGLLAMRAINKELRRSGKRTKGPPKRTEEQNKRFEESLRRILKNAEV